MYDTTVRIPKSLPCRHTFCVLCLSKRRPEVCPKCETPVDFDAEGLPVDQNIMEHLVFVKQAHIKQMASHIDDLKSSLTNEKSSKGREKQTSDLQHEVQQWVAVKLKQFSETLGLRLETACQKQSEMASALAAQDSVTDKEYTEFVSGYKQIKELEKTITCGKPDMLLKKMLEW